MSIEAVSWAFKQDITPAAKKFVLVALADNADQHGICFPSYGHIQKKTCLGRRAVINFVNDLVEEGFVQKAARLRGDNSYSSNAYRLPFCDGTLAEHPLQKLFDYEIGGGAHGALGSAQDALGGSAQDALGSAHGAPLITIKEIKKEKKGPLSRPEFLREIDKGVIDGQFSAFAHLTESEIKIAAEACWDFWAGKGEWPGGGDTVAIVRNWLRGGMAKGRIRKAEQQKPAQADGAAMSAEDSRWRLRVKGFVGQGLWQPQWGPAPDESNCKVPMHLMNEFFPDGKIPSTQTA